MPPPCGAPAAGCARWPPRWSDTHPGGRTRDPASAARPGRASPAELSSPVGGPDSPPPRSSVRPDGRWDSPPPPAAPGPGPNGLPAGRGAIRRAYTIPGPSGRGVRHVWFVSSLGLLKIPAAVRRERGRRTAGARRRWGIGTASQGPPPASAGTWKGSCLRFS